MKKIFLIVCFMFFGVNVKALEPTLYYQNNIYSNRVGAENKIWSGPMAFIFMNGQIVYCLDPYLIVGHDYTIDENYHFSFEDLEYYSLVAYYGYNNTNRNSIYYYMAAQELVWDRIIGKGKTFWTTGQYNTGDRIDISRYKNEIEKDINEYYAKPNLNNFYKLRSFEKLELHDTSNLLSRYNMTTKGNSIVTKKDNDISIIMYDRDLAEIKLERKLSNDIPTIVYHTSSGQTLAQFGTDIRKTMTIKVMLDYFKTTVYLNFYNEKTKEKIENVDFSICDSDVEIEETDKGYKLEDIKEGEYKLCGLNQEESFIISRDNYTEETNIDIYLKQEEPVKSRSNINETKIDIKEELPIIHESKEFPSELPNTCDYESKIYAAIFCILIGCGLYKIS